MDQQLQNKGDWGSKYGKLLTFKFTNPMRVENLDPSPHTYCIYTYKSVLSRSFGGIVEASNFPRITSLTKPGFLLRYSSWKRDPGRLLRFSQSSLGTVHCHVFHLISSFLLSNYSCWIPDLIYNYIYIALSSIASQKLIHCGKERSGKFQILGWAQQFLDLKGKTAGKTQCFEGRHVFLWPFGIEDHPIFPILVTFPSPQQLLVQESAQSKFHSEVWWGTLPKMHRSRVVSLMSSLEILF